MVTLDRSISAALSEIVEDHASDRIVIEVSASSSSQIRPVDEIRQPCARFGDDLRVPGEARTDVLLRSSSPKAAPGAT